MKKKEEEKSTYTFEVETCHVQAGTNYYGSRRGPRANSDTKENPPSEIKAVQCHAISVHVISNGKQKVKKKTGQKDKNSRTKKKIKNKRKLYIIVVTIISLK